MYLHMSNPTESYMDMSGARKHRGLNNDEVTYLTIIDDNGKVSYVPIHPDDSNQSGHYHELGEGYYYPGLPVQN